MAKKQEAEQRHCLNCGAVVQPDRPRSPFCSETCKDAKDAKR